MLIDHHHAAVALGDQIAIVQLQGRSTAASPGGSTRSTRARRSAEARVRLVGVALRPASSAGRACSTPAARAAAPCSSKRALLRGAVAGRESVCAGGGQLAFGPVDQFAPHVLGLLPDRRPPPLRSRRPVASRAVRSVVRNACAACPAVGCRAGPPPESALPASWDAR